MDEDVKVNILSFNLVNEVALERMLTKRHMHRASPDFLGWQNSGKQNP